MPCCRNGEADHAGITIEGEVIRRKGEHSVLLAACFVCYTAQIRSSSIHSQWYSERFRIQRCDSNTWSIYRGMYKLPSVRITFSVGLWKYSMIHSATAFVDQEGSPHIFHMVNSIQNLQREGIPFPSKGYQKYLHYTSYASISFRHFAKQLEDIVCLSIRIT